MVNRNVKNQNSLNIFLNQYFNILILFVIVVALVFSYLIILKPKFDQTLGAIQENILNQQKLYAEQKNKLADLKLISEVYGKISPEELQKFNSALPNQYVQERLYGEIEEIIVSSGFIVDSIRLASKEEKANLSKEDEALLSLVPKSDKIGQVPVEISLSAIDYTGFKNLLRLIENNLRLFDIVDVNFSNAENKLSLKLITYYYKNGQ